MNLDPHNQMSLKDNSDCFRFLKSIGKEIRVVKGQCLVKEGEICKNIFLFTKGVFRSFRYVKNEEVTIGFSFPGDLYMSPYSCVNDFANPDIIEALTDGTVVKIDFNVFMLSAGSSVDRQSFLTRYMSNYIEVLIQRIIDYHTNTSEYNYLKLNNERSSEATKIPLMHVASYLSITPERLSRIRKKLNKVKSHLMK